MSNLPWHAYYYEGVETTRPPTRSEMIEAETESDAANVAKSHMGRCKRVEIVGPRWASAQMLVILADEGQDALGRPR